VDCLTRALSCTGRSAAKWRITASECNTCAYEASGLRRRDGDILSQNVTPFERLTLLRLTEEGHFFVFLNDDLDGAFADSLLPRF
jgi:hypothetical protein